MKPLDRRFLLLGAGAAVVVWGTVFSLYGACRERLDRGQVVARAEGVATALTGVLDAAAEGGPEGLSRALAGAVRGDLVRAAAVIGSDGASRAVSPGLELGAAPLASAACAVCHGAGQVGPRRAAVFSGGVLHLFRPGAVGGGHLYLALEPGLLAPGGGDLWLVFATGLVAVGVLAAGLLGALRGRVLRPASQLAEQLGAQLGAGAGAGLQELVAAAGAAAVARGGMERNLRRCAARWEGAGDRAFRHLEELKQGAQVTREIGRHILAAAEQLNTTVEGFRGHLNGISRSTSDNSTSLIEMSASIDEVAGVAEQLSRFVASSATSVDQMVKAIGEVADRVETLARETDTTASSMAHIDASTREIEVNAREATLLSGRMAEAARDGSRAVEETLRGIHSSYGVIQDTARAMDELQESSLAIGGVVKIINEINDKTKLLALNAAIIAAQAGEHGKSFAVVAHEIKSLSDRTASSTGEISRLIKGIRGRMAVAAEAVARGEGATGSSVELAERAGEALLHILDTAQISHDMTREILGATEEQSRGSQRVMASMQEVNAMVTYIRQAAGEHRSSGEAVTAQTGTMRELTEQVKLATAEQAEVSRYISDAIAAIDRNLQTMVDAVDRKRGETDRLFTHAGELRERGKAGAREVEAVEDSLRGVTEELRALGAALGAERSRAGEGEG
ncbi:MAG TPA: methyl-accepting chemotaxis protein [Deferrisomatales bacterium]|nr:methyl-accepting chemotaxis protein [Deferrisomatales bacterium]